MSDAFAGNRRDALVALLGGSFIIAGALLPWMSLFAGLQRYSGIHGVYGRAALAEGVFTVLAGVTLLSGASRLRRILVGVPGLMMALFAAWILSQVYATTRSLASHPMLLARPGPGVFVVLVGALIAASLLIPRQRFAIGE